MNLPESVLLCLFPNGLVLSRQEGEDEEEEAPVVRSPTVHSWHSRPLTPPSAASLSSERLGGIERGGVGRRGEARHRTTEEEGHPQGQTR